MAIKAANRVFVTTSSTGSGTPFVCSSTAAAAAYRTLAQECTDGASYYYGRYDSTGLYEEGYGVLTLATRTITPTAILRSSNGVGTPVNWSGGTQNVILQVGQGSILAAQNNLSEIASPSAARANIGAEAAFASGTKVPFVQSAAPTGWTQVTSVNDKVLRVVSGAGGGTGGSNTIAGLTVGGTALTVSNLPAHHHGAYFKKNSMTYNAAGSPVFVSDVSDATDGTYTAWQTQDAGSGTTHTHTISHDGTKAYAYQDVIVCSKN